MAEVPKQQPSYVGNPPSIPGKLIISEWPTPILDDRILVLRKDLRKFPKLPRKGSKFIGPNAEEFRDFRFATAKPSDQIGWVNFFYINERKNQDEYNFEITYPYASKDFPTVTRNYVFLRGDQRGKEPDADSKDPVYGDLSLTDHKVIRLQQPELDALFVGIQRVYERLPGPVIISHKTNQYQQDVTIAEQEDIAPAFPVVSALSEEVILERKTTAKAKTTDQTVDTVFPDTNYMVSRDDAVIPYRHRKFLAALPSVQVSQIAAGTATQPVLADTDWTATDHQTTKYKHQFSRTVRLLTVPISLIEYRLTPEQQLSTVIETWAPGMQTVTPQPLLIDADSIQLGNNESIKSETTIPDVFPQAIYETEIPDPVPLKFRVTIPVVASTLTSIGTAIPPTLTTGQLSIRDEQTKEFWHRLTTRGRDVTQLPVSLVSYELTPEQQVGMITETLAVGLQTLSPDALWLKASVENLGNNTSLKSTTTVPDVFPQSDYEIEIPDPIPLKFRVTIPISTTAQTFAGTAVPPVLGVGELSAKDEQTKEFWHRLTIKGRDPSQLPISLVSYELTPDQQVSMITETLAVGLQTLTADGLLIKANVDNLGNSTSLKSTTTIPDVFPQSIYETEIPDPIPLKFRVTVPVTSSTLTSLGTATPPVLATGNLSRKDEQTKEFWHRLTIRGRDPTQLPVSLVSYEITPEQQLGTTVETLATGLQTVAPDAVTAKGSVDNLGNNTSLKSVTTVPDVFNRAEYRVTIPDIIPERFRVAVPTSETTLTSAGTAALPVLQTGDLERSDIQEKEFWHRLMIRGRAGVVLPVSLLSYELTPEQQIGTVTETLANGLQTLTADALTIKAKVDNLGNNTSLKSTTTTPDVFNRAEYRVTIPDIIPERFRVAVPTSETTLTTAGTAALPVLQTGDLERSDVQEKEFWHRLMIRGRAGVVLPVSLQGYEMTPEQQLGTITETLANGLQTLTLDALTIKANVENLGNNTSLKSATTVPDVFNKAEYRVTIPDIIPERFRVAVPTSETALTSAGTASLPVLQTGDLERTDVQEKEFWHRLTIRGRAGVVLPVSLQGYELTPERQVGTITETLANGLQTLSPDALIIKANVENLGNNTSLRSTTTVPDVFNKAEYKVTIPDIIPERFRVAVPTSETALTSAGTASLPVLQTGDLERTDVQENEFWRRLTIRGRAGVVLPVSLQGYELTPEQQIGTITETLANGLQTLTADALTIKANVENLGNNTSLKSATTVPDVFSKAEYKVTIPDIIPERFRVAVPTSETSLTSAGTAALPVLQTGDLERTDVQEKEFWHRLTIRGRAGVVLPVSLQGYEMTPEQQIGTITETLAAGLQTIAPDAFTVKASVDNLGNNTSLKTATVVPDVFGKSEYSITIPDIIPEKFRVAVPTTESAVTLAGTAAPPVLATGDLERRDEQTKEFWHRLTIRGRAGVVLPVSLQSYKMNREKQVVTVTETLANGLQTIAPTALTDEAEVTNLGNNTSLQVVGTVPTVFAEQQYEVTIPDLVPPEFKAFVPTRVTETTVAGNAVPPTLATGDISASNKQLDEFKYRSRVETRAGIPLPQTFLNRELTKEYGGATTTIGRILDLTGAPTMTLDEGFLILRSEIKNLGNGMSLKETQFNDQFFWTPLVSSLWDDNMRVQYTETNTIVAPGTAPAPDPGGATFAWLSEVKKLDKWHSVQITTNKPRPPYQSPATALITSDFKPYRFPGYLQNSGTGFYTRAAEAVLVEHVIRTWWEKSIAKPTIAYDKIITGDVIINNLTNTGLEYARNVLHDGFSFGTLFFPATTPTATQYSLGTQSGTVVTNIINLYQPGTGYFAGQTIVSVPGVVITVLSTGVAGSVLSYSPIVGSFGFPVGVSGPFPGGSVPASAAVFYVTGITVPVYAPGTMWIGTERIIDASVTPEKEPNIWKCQTKSVVMQ